jgi:hypothetical protein
MTDEMRSSISLDLGLKLGNANRGRLPTAFPYANGAAFNSYELQHEAKCLPSTRIDLLRSVIQWTNGAPGQCIFRLNGYCWGR